MFLHVKEVFVKFPSSPHRINSLHAPRVIFSSVHAWMRAFTVSVALKYFKSLFVIDYLKSGLHFMRKAEEEQ
jgi:hypothetical protein